MKQIDQIIESIRQKYQNPDPELATVIPRDEFEDAIYSEIVERCANLVDHIQVWDGNLGDHIRRKMGTL